MGIKRLLKTMIPGCSLLLTPILFASNGTIGVDSDAETGLQVAADSSAGPLFAGYEERRRRRGDLYSRRDTARLEYDLQK